MAAAEEADGPRMVKLRQALDKALEKVVETSSFDKVSSKFPDLIAEESDARRSDFLKDLYTQLLKNVEQNTKGEFEMILKENNVKEVLNRLDEMIAQADAQGLKTAARQTSEPSDVEAHLGHPLGAQEAHFQAVLAGLDAETAELMREVQAERAALRAVLEGARGREVDLAKAALQAEQALTPQELARMEEWIAQITP